MIPNDPIILMSYINTQLRDKYPSFEDFCDDNELSAEEILTKLKSAGFTYDTSSNQFK